ncbi:Gx transporter family protein [Candidatus Stoquefichus sp. SB1]|jgi:heptaprenyl diphosphate synthase|uniref:Gx transporter family protein n=1 Tax=Candidatus Stoquefichus sp. SB1 TaxID=1658109 RepID=UPI00067E872E|nr:Gx transporter family protein [Candidatus Stoquefichus sp. SB1]
MGHKKTKKMVYLALLSAIAIVLHMIEGSIPLPLPPGVKLGLANIISMVVIEMYGAKEMFIVNFFRVMIGSLLSGTFLWNPFYMSCGGVLLSSIVLALIKRWTTLPIVSCSIIAAVFHNIGQIIVISLIISSMAVAPYIFVMLASSIPTGIFVGFVAIEILKRLKKEQFQ